jgi:phosphohistidine phosphatase
MKILLVLRHAEAAPDSGEGDEARPLTEKGEKDAVTIGRQIAATFGCPEHIAVSDARRARQTAEIVAAQQAGSGAAVALESAIYEADAETLFGVVERFPDAAEVALLVGHNPGVWQFARTLVGEGTAAMSPLPPAGLYVLDIPAARWVDVLPGTASLRAVYHP